MSIENAKKFIKIVEVDKNIRNQLNSAKNSDELYSVLNKYGFDFSYSDFDNAYHNMLLQCQFEEQANQLKEFKMWWELCLQFSGALL